MVKTSNFLLKASNEIVEQGESKYNQNFLVIFLLSRNIIIMLSNVFNFLYAAAGCWLTSEQKRKRDLRAIQTGKGFRETNNGHS